ncbi:MAG: DUF3575 domain-containing protein [Cyclobacteriaceae bacterium]|nr:DUF3575 domain-containing protein [Cyclobacteriaceae bacterium]
MKKTFIILVLSVAYNIANAQTNAIKINYLAPIVKTINLQFEHALNESSSVQLGVYYLSWAPQGTTTKFSGYGITPEYRFYLTESTFKGVFLGPYFRFQSLKLSDTSTADDGVYTGYQGGAIIGKQWLFKDKITLEAFLGPCYGGGNVKVNSGTDVFNVDTFNGFGLRIGTTLGFAF